MCSFSEYYLKHGHFPVIRWSDKCCLLCTSYFLLVFFVVFTGLTLNLYPPKPLCSIPHFHISTTPNSTTTTNNNQTIYFDVKLQNQENFNGIYYDPLNLTISYRPIETTNKTMSLVAAYTFPGFYQGFHKSATRSGLAMVDGAVLNGTVDFRVKLDTRARYKGAWGVRKKYHLLVAANFKVDVKTGYKVSKRGVKLTRTNAAVAEAPGLCRLVVVVVLSISTAVILLVL